MRSALFVMKWLTYLGAIWVGVLLLSLLWCVYGDLVTISQTNGAPIDWQYGGVLVGYYLFFPVMWSKLAPPTFAVAPVLSALAIFRGFFWPQPHSET